MKRSLRYHVGNLPSTLSRTLLSHPWFPLFRTACSGLEWPYDVCRHAGTRNMPVILDVGANVGQTALYLAQFFPHSTIHSFELSPSTAAILRQNTRQHPNIKVHAQALGLQATTMEVEQMDCSLINSMRFALSSPTTTQLTESIEVITLDRFCQAQGLNRVDILKIDAQGFDLDVLKGGEEMISQGAIPFIYVEITFDKHHTDAQWFLPVHEHLLGHHYHLCGIYEQWYRGSLLDCCNALYYRPART
ncbi:MAG: FkbM family methyltransferase [Blastochloris sp.]|nr:FkbM family methyltransferase [Blastochloris sp.]